MTKFFQQGIEKAKLNGHEFINDPPVFASVNRYTCKHCGQAVLGKGMVIYGSALEKDCLNESFNQKKN